MQDDYVAKMDQGRKGAEDMADLMAAFYLRLEHNGVPEEQAGRIAEAYTRSTVANCNQRREA